MLISDSSRISLLEGSAEVVIWRREELGAVTELHSMHVGFPVMIYLELHVQENWHRYYGSNKPPKYPHSTPISEMM